MFGYVKAYTPELKVKEFELYRAAYCGVCRSMGKCTGCLSRLTLTWDSVFLFFLRSALTRTPFELHKRRCFLHPLSRRAVAEGSPELEYCARATAIMVAGKLKDDRKDERGAKRICASLLSPFSAHAKKRAALPLLAEHAEKLLGELSALEQENTASFDAPADLSARLTAQLFAFGLPDGSAEERIARDVGYHTGKLVYAADAADDLAEDVKKKRYNPYFSLFGTAALGEREKAIIRDALRCETDAIMRDLDLIDFSGIDGIRAILFNVIRYGIPRRTEEILTGNKAGKDDL